MSTKYNNYKKFLEALGFKVEPETPKKRLAYICSLGHRREMGYDTFSTLKPKIVKSKGAKTFCNTCDNLDEKKKQEARVVSMLSKDGHRLVEFRDLKSFTYRCSNCDAESKTNIQALERSTRTEYCKHCQNDARRLSTEEVDAVLRHRGMELAAPYTTNKRVSVRCHCGEVFTSSIHRIKNGSTCWDCGRKRAAITNEEKFGAANVFASEYGKAKSVETNMEKRGVPYAQMNLEVSTKTRNTNMEKFGYPYAFNLPETYVKIRATHIANHKVPFPLQSKEIRAKCRKTTFDKFGAEYFIQTEEFKRQMLEKYGEEYFVQTEEFKRQMLEKYGAEHAMQNPDLFRKMKASGYSSKNFTFPSGRVVTVQGYEPAAITFLLNFYDEASIEVDVIPVVNYIFEEGKHVYHPDIYIQSENLIIEVKSVYTLALDYEKNMAKFQAVVASGYSCRLLVFEKGTDLEPIDDVFFE